MQLKTIANILGDNGSDYPDVDVKWLLTDSRSLSFPSETLFFAIKSSRNDGHDYIQELYNKNLRYFVVNEIRLEFSNLTDAYFFCVEDTISALQLLAKTHRESFDIPVIGITGSNGKTIVKEWLYQLLHQDYRIARSPRSYNSQIGVPLSVWSISKETNLAIFEAGISQLNEIEKLQKIIIPSIGILTNIGEAHQENFSGLKQKCAEKLKLFKDSKVLIFCSDNKLIDITIAQSEFKGKVFSWGENSTSNVRIEKIKKESNYSVVTICYNDSIFDIHLPFLDAASLENAMHCVALMLYLKIDVKIISSRISQLESVEMRMEVKQGVRNCLLIDDTYNSDINSLIIALDFLNQQASCNNLSKTLILSDILQSGQNMSVLYKNISELVFNKDVNKLIGIGPEISKFADVFLIPKKEFYLDTDQFLNSNSIKELHDEIILLKGSRTFKFEEISVQLEHVLHETIMEVNLNALIDNLNYFRSKLKNDTKIVCMVKAFAYGSGSVEIARTLQHHKCDYLAVAVGDEGAELRREGIRIPIIVMNPEIGAFGLILKNNLEPEIYNFRILQSFVAAIDKLGIVDYPIHIKLDTGMNRLGFHPDEVGDLINFLKSHQQVKIKSIFSHLSASDDALYDDFTRKQVNVFNQCASQLVNEFSHHILLHILNSAGIERFPEYQFDMVRLGIGHYGISALNNVKLRTVCSLKSIILQIKNVPAGESVGYARKSISNKDRIIGIVPIGYADGYNRKLGNGVGEVFVGGRRAKVIGNICMDLCMIDITGMDVSEGDSVEIFGEHITLSEISTWLDTIPYEVLTGISRRVKRVYFQE